MNEADYRAKLLRWAAAERSAVAAEEAVRSALEEKEQGAPPALEDLQRTAQERRAEANALFQDLYGKSRRKDLGASEV